MSAHQKPNPEQPSLIELPPLAIGTSYTDEGEEFQILHLADPPPARDLLGARFPSGRVIPFHGHRRMERLELHTANIEWAGEIVATGIAHVFVDCYLVFGFRFSDTVQALDKAKEVFTWFRRWPVITEWSYAAVKRELLGRAVYYREQPAVVKQFIGELGQVILVPEEDTKFAAPPWGNPEAGWDQGVRLDLLSSEIHWYRDNARR